MITDDKAELRKVMQARREAIPAEARKAAAQAVAEHGLPAGVTPGAKIVSAYWAIGPELDPGPLERRLKREGHRICLPAIQGRKEAMKFHLWTSGEPMRERKWGIMEPLASAPEVDPDVLLVPLLAFDAQGWRLGYGGGYYDRTIAALRQRKAIVLVGFAFDEQRVDAVPHLDYDERLDFILTPSGVIHCT